MDLEIKSGLPFAKLKIGSTRYQLMLSTWFPDILLFSKAACLAKEVRSQENGVTLTADEQADLQMCSNIETYDDLGKKHKLVGSFEDPSYLQGKLKGYYIQETIEDIQAQHSWLADILPAHTFKVDLEKLHALTNYAGIFSQKAGPEDKEKASERQCKIGVMTEWPPELANINNVGQFDGLLGLMILPVKEANKRSPLFEYFTENNKIDSKRFGLYLNDARNKGQLILGGIDPSYEDSLINVPVIPDGPGWLIKIDSIKVGSKELGTNLKAYVDTTTTSFIGKIDLIQKINTELKAKEIDQTNEDIETGENVEEALWVFEDCQNLPDVIFTISGKEYTLDPSTTIQRTYTLCASAFHAAKLVDYDIIIGSTFLNKYYTVFEGDKKLIQFAEAKEKKGPK